MFDNTWVFHRHTWHTLHQVNVPGHWTVHYSAHYSVYTDAVVKIKIQLLN